MDGRRGERFAGLEHGLALFDGLVDPGSDVLVLARLGSLRAAGAG